MTLFLFGFLLSLVSQAAGYSFPYGRCYDGACGSSPYRLTWVSDTPVSKDESKYCLQFRTRPCVDTQYKCCSTLTNALPKFELHLRTECKTSLKKVTIDGVTKRGGVFFDVYTNKQSELRITSLTNINVSTVNARTFCIHVGAPCIPLSNFLFSNKTAIWEVSKHECCPKCDALYDYPFGPPPPPLPVASPPPPSPPVASPPPLQPSSNSSDRCGNKMCEPDLGEDCKTCASDCNGGKKFCCGSDRPLCGNKKCFRTGRICARTTVG
jgi:hypothetical protein